MPRKRKTMSGADAQNIPSTAGVRYGEGDDMQELQADLPSPDTQGTVGGSPGGPGAAPMPMPMPPDPQQVQGFLGSHNPALLSGTQEPDTPVTAGLSTGPGPGPSALRRNTAPIARFYEQLAADTGDPKWRRLAQRAGLL